MQLHYCPALGSSY